MIRVTLTHCTVLFLIFIIIILFYFIYFFALHCILFYIVKLNLTHLGMAAEYVETDLISGKIFDKIFDAFLNM